MINLENVSLKFKEKIVLNNINYTFADTGFYVVQGETGSGKSSLLKCISGIYETDEGQINFSSDFNLKNDLFYSVSEVNLVPSLSVLENAELIFSKSKVKEIKAYIQKYDLNYILKRKALKLSSGEAQKISLIFALVRRAKITLLDEPLCNVDIESLPLFYEELKVLGKISLVIAVMHNTIPLDYVNGMLEIAEGTIKEKKLNLSSAEIQSDTNEINWGKALKNSLILFCKRPKLIFFLFTFFLFIVFYIFATAILLNTTSDACLYARGITEHSPQYSNVQPSNYDALKPIEKVQAKYEIWRNNVATSSIPFTSIYMTDFIYSEGTKIDLNEKDIYISDYLYAVLLGYEMDQSVLLPTETLKDFVASNLTLHTSLSLTVGDMITDVNFKIYKTNYLEYLPEKNSISYTSDLRNFKKQIDDYYMNIYAAPYVVARLYMGSYDEELKQPTSFLLSDLLVKKNMTSYNLNLTGNEFYCSKGFFVNTLGYTKEEVESKDFLKSVDGKSFTIEFKSNTKTVSKTLVLKCPNFILIDNAGQMYNQSIYLSDFIFEELFPKLECLDGKNLAHYEETHSFIDTEASDFEIVVEKVLKDKDAKFLQRPAVDTKIEARENARIIFITICSVCAFVIVFIIVLYCFLYVKNEIKELFFLAMKGYGLHKLILSRYLIQGVLLIMEFGLSILLLYKTNPYLAVIFNML